ncbi:hypothetical protein H5410_006137 [Solanum commersonii]|uniref:Uncharacterized protein n=1 Tax=Solanum commersonii TaxID=4109 RepID=A0A9J6AAE1_SOLCO|nr:hypothetical protein H5410_006137 [Solanum commersonii]
MDSFISSRNNVMKSVKEWSPLHPQASNTDERDHYALAKPILLQNEAINYSYGLIFICLTAFSNYLKVVSDIGIEDTIVDNREDNGVEKNFLIEENSTKVVLQGIRGDVTNEVDEEFSDPDYNLSDEDDDFQDVIDDQQVLIDDQQVPVDDQQVLIDDQQVLINNQQVKKLRGRPKNASVNVPVSSEILVPLQNANAESDYAYSDELPDDDVQSDKGENNGQEYDEGAKVFDNFHLSPKYIARKYLNIFKADPGWNISGIVEIAPIEEQVIVVQTDVVATQGVDEVAIKGIETTRLSHTSKRGTLFKRKVMKEYIVELHQKKKKKKIGNHSKV